jgi:hypothetical protein
MREVQQWRGLLDYEAEQAAKEQRRQAAQNRARGGKGGRRR